MNKYKYSYLTIANNHNRCYFDSLRRESVSSLGADANLYPVRDTNHPRSVSPSEYVAMVKDIIRLQKNICLCRHFHTLDLHSIQKYVSAFPYFLIILLMSLLSSSQKKSMYMDVWPMNFFKRQYSEEFDTSSLFQLQLACILHMVLTFVENKKELKVNNSIFAGSCLEKSRVTCLSFTVA